MDLNIWHTGTVIRGLGNGRKLGFPTANLAPDAPLELTKGVYAVWVIIDGQRHKGMLYVGTRPTLGLHELTYEIHIFGIRRNLYNKRISFRVICRIRKEKRFKNEKELTAAMLNDMRLIQNLLKNPTHTLLTRALVPEVMDIIEQARQRMRKRNLDQWQDGYPNEAAIRADHANHQGHVFLKEGETAAYAAIVFGPDPYYQHIEGQWLSDGEPYVTAHRMAVHDKFLGLGIAQHILRYAEKLAVRKGVRWFRIDTHHDNLPMRNLIREAGFTFCGIVQVRDGERLAYEKELF